MSLSRLLDHKAVAVVVAGLVGLASSAAFLGLLWTYFDPRWETNDDVAMSMVAHGYGIAAYGSPHLIFSNILWGHVVRRIPAFGGLLGYSLGTMAALCIAGATIVFFLLRLRVNVIIAISAMALVMLQPALMPQFTITAGLLAAAAVLGIVAYDRQDCIVSLIVACGLVFTGFLIRNLEVALVFAVAAPLLPWRRVKDSRAWIAAGGLLIALFLATAYDIASYRGEAWAAFRNLQYARAPFTDFGASSLVLDRPDVMQKYGLSVNDIGLITHWFFVDRKLADPAVLSAVLKDVSFLSTSTFDIDTALVALKYLTGPYLLALVEVAAGLILLALRARLAGAALIAVGLIAFLGGAGRPHVTRVFVPMVSMVVLLGVAFVDLREWRRRLAAALVLLAGLAASAWLIWPNVVAAQAAIERARADRFKAAVPLVVWGSVMPLEVTFPPFTKASDVTDTKMIGLGVFTYAPFSVSQQLDLVGNGMIKQLLSPTGIAIYATVEYLERLRVYCAERHGGVLEAQEVSKSMYGTLRQVKCPATR